MKTIVATGITVGILFLVANGPNPPESLPWELCFILTIGFGLALCTDIRDLFR